MEFLKKQVGPFPVGVWIGIIAAGALVGVVFMRYQSGKSTAPGSSASQNLQNSNNQNPPNAGEDYTGQAANIDQYGAANAPVYVVGVSPATPQPPAANAPVTAPPNPTPPVNTFSIRARETTPGSTFYQYDRQASGVPFRASATNLAEIGKIPYGSQVSIISGPVSGANAGGGTGINTNTWYLVSYQGKSGAVSTQDIIGVGGGGGMNIARAFG